MHVEYKDIPDNIKESREVKTVIRKSKVWPVRKLLSEYMISYNQGMKEYDPNSDLEQRFKNIQLVNICSYYLLKKELLTRMSPLISIRSRKFIALDNKILLDKFDECLEAGIEKDFERSQALMTEITKRLEVLEE